MSIKRIVIVGAGQAGANAILQLRANQYQGEIVLIGDEAHLPYERPPLSKEMILTPAQTRVEILSAEKLDELKVRRICGHAVTEIQPQAHQLMLDDGRCIDYDKLLLATGASPRRLPDIDALGPLVYSLRNLEDAHALADLFQADRHILLLGGGVIGLELASSARKKHCQVTIVEAGASLMARRTPQLLSDFLLQQQRLAGVNVLLQTHITHCEQANGQLSVQLSDGQCLQVDGLIYGIGVIPNVQLAQDAGLAVDAGILVDQYCLSSDPDIYAAGDVCRQRHADGSYQRLETWENANRQANIFAHHVLGLDLPAQQPTWFWSDQLDINYQFVGDMQAKQWFVRGELDATKQDANSCVLFGVSNQQIVAGITINAGKEMRHIKKMISQQMHFEAALHLDPDQQLRKLAS